MADVYLTPKEYFGNESCKIYNEFINKEKYFERLIELMKYKILPSCSKDTIQLLTLAPATCSIEKVSEVFGVSKLEGIQR